MRKNALRECIREILREGEVTRTSTPTASSTAGSGAPAAQPAAPAAPLSDDQLREIGQNVSSWITANYDAISEAGDYYKNPLPTGVDVVSQIIAAAYKNDKDKGHPVPVTVMTVCMQIDGTEDTWFTEILSLGTGFLKDMFLYASNLEESHGRSRKRLLNEFAPIAWFLAAPLLTKVATVIGAVTAYDMLRGVNPGTSPANLDELKNAVQLPASRIAMFLGRAHRSQALALQELTNRSTAENPGLGQTVG